MISSSAHNQTKRKEKTQELSTRKNKPWSTVAKTQNQCLPAKGNMWNTLMLNLQTGVGQATCCCYKGRVINWSNE